MHFQACPSNALPLEALAADDSKRVLKKKEGTVSIWALTTCGRQVILIESRDKKDMELAIRRLVEGMRKTLGVSDEPMLNVLCSFTGGMWRLIIFPRSKHRPDVYFLQGNDRVLISPGAVDLGGLIITPIEKDFVSVDAKIVKDVFREVSLDGQAVERILRTV
jgi:hypothetical protein